MNHIAITSDVDWAPEPVLEYMIDILATHGIKCTFFCTHFSEVLKKADKSLFELALHPNFNPLLIGSGGSAESILNELIEQYPEAKGIRSHSMMQSTNLLNLFAEKGMQYESNHFLPYHTNIEPFKLWNGLIRLPYVWEDDVHWMYENTFDDLKIDVRTTGLKIFDFHPVHIYINTRDQAHYEMAKPYYQQPLELVQYRQLDTTKTGAKDGLMQLINLTRESNLPTYLLREIAAEFQHNSKN